MPTWPRPPSLPSLSPPPHHPLHSSVFPTPASFCHHAVGVVSPHVPLFSANKLPCGLPAPPTFLSSSLHRVLPPAQLLPPLPSFSHCSSHRYVSGNTRLFCIRLFSPLWQAGLHANMQNGDGEAFCRVMRKGRGQHCEWCRRVRLYTCVFQQILWLVSAIVGTGASATRTKAQVSNMAMEYQPKQQ